MEVRKATYADSDRISELYNIGRQYMRDNGNMHQWVNGYPDIRDITEDIGNGCLFVITDSGEICGVFFFKVGHDKTYDYIEGGSWLNDKPYGVIHRISSDSVHHGIFRCAFEYAKREVDDIRVDTHADNLTMQRAVEKCGFKKCGTIYVEDGTPRIAYHFSK